MKRWVETQLSALADANRIGARQSVPLVFCPNKCCELTYKHVADLGVRGTLLEALTVAQRQCSTARHCFDLNVKVVKCPTCGDPMERGLEPVVTCANIRCKDEFGSFCAVHQLTLERCDAVTQAELDEVQAKQEKRQGHLRWWRVCRQCIVETREQLHNPSLTSQLLRRLGTKPCPNCKEGIAKAEGCRHMTCTWCHHEFFWCCGRAYRDNADATAHRKDTTCDDYATHTYYPGTDRDVL